MGGYGSGAHAARGARPSTDRAIRLDVRKLARDGMIAEPGCIVSSPLIWSRGPEIVWAAGLTHDGDGERLELRHRRGRELVWEQTISTERTPCTYGGSRIWVRCPGCGSRRAVLWRYGEWFACRECHGLAYASTRRSDDERLYDRADRLARRIDPAWERRFGDLPPKPRGMHMLRYLRLADEILEAEREAMYRVVARWGGPLELDEA